MLTTLWGRLGRAFHRVAFWVPLVLCMGVAFTPEPAGVAASLSGALAHVAAFAYLTMALFLAHYPSGRPVLAVALWLAAFGVLIEIVQLLFVAGRSGQLADVVVNAGGIALGYLAYAAWRRLKVALA